MSKYKVSMGVYPYRKFEKGTGTVTFTISGLGDFSLNKDQIRELYYKVLGIDGLPETTIDEEIETVKASDFINVDVPEDVLRVEKKFALERISRSDVFRRAAEYLGASDTKELVLKAAERENLDIESLEKVVKFHGPNVLRDGGWKYGHWM